MHACMHCGRYPALLEAIGGHVCTACAIDRMKLGVSCVSAVLLDLLTPKAPPDPPPPPDGLFRAGRVEVGARPADDGDAPPPKARRRS